MKKSMLALVLVLVLLLTQVAVAFAVETPFSIDGDKYVVDIPTLYMAYTSYLGSASGYSIATGQSAALLDSYMQLLDCCVFAEHMLRNHSFILCIEEDVELLNTVKTYQGLTGDALLYAYYDYIAASKMLANLDHELTMEDINAVKGNYIVEERKGNKYFVFQKETEFEVRTIVNDAEYRIKWISGNGTMSTTDISEMVDVLSSVMIAK